MASNFVISGRGDLDSIFKPHGTGARPGPDAAATGFYVGSQDLNGRYNGVNGTGLDLISFTTSGYFLSKDTSKGNGGDLRYIFQASGYN